ncbi:hypothetical protein LPJ53_006311, partial [Coemansia erecta]
VVEDTTASTLGDVFPNVATPVDNSSGGNSGSKNEDPRPVPFRVHKRVATTPVGKPLRYLDCPLKFAKVMADAMRAHYRIRWNADILHRDISSNNILFYETDDGDVHGLLIDFDHAVDLSVPEVTRHLDRSGDVKVIDDPFEKRAEEEYELMTSLFSEEASMVYSAACYHDVHDVAARDSLDPHVFELVAVAYAHMRQLPNGGRHSTKAQYQMAYLGTIVEAFASAATAESMGATRVGLWHEVQFNEHGHISGAKLAAFGLDRW